MTQAVTVYAVDDAGAQQAVGTLSLGDGGRVVADPDDDDTLDHVLDIKAVDFAGDRRVLTSRSDPAAWLANLHRVVSGSRVRVSRSEGDAGASASTTPLPGADVLALAMVNAADAGDHEAVARLKELAADPGELQGLLDDLGHGEDAGEPGATRGYSGDPPVRTYAGFDPAQPRDGAGRWAGVGAVVAAFRAASGRPKGYLETALFNANPDATDDDPTAGHEGVDPRDMMERLVSGWRDAHRAGHDDAREALEAAMAHFPELRKVGAAGEQVPFDGALHLGDPGQWTGDPAEVVRPGWVIDRGGGRRSVVEKAQVRRPAGGTVAYAWGRDTTRNGHVKAVGTGEHSGRVLYGKKAEAALAAQGHRAAGTDKASARKRAVVDSTIAVAAALNDPSRLSAERVGMLADHLSTLSRDQLRQMAKSVREKVGGKKAELADRLLEHVRSERRVTGGAGDALAAAPARQGGASRAAGDTTHEMTRAEFMAGRGLSPAAGPTGSAERLSHDREYTRALRSAARAGRPIPDAVLASEPDIAGMTDRNFAPWELTRDQHSSHSMFNPAHHEAGHAHADHAAEVRGAVRRGDPVPPHVLAEYPALSVRQPATSPPPPAEPEQPPAPEQAPALPPPEQAAAAATEPSGEPATESQAPKLSRDTPNSFSTKFTYGGVSYGVHAHRDAESVGEQGDRAPWDVEFITQAGDKPAESKGTTGVAGHSAVGAMRKVGAAVSDWMAEHKPERVKFLAASDEPSRVKLYERLANALAAEHGYAVTRADGANVRFLLTRKSEPVPDAPP